ncbi:MAG: DUF5360 family protein [Candidatus Sericytochromatia bacterium]
MNNNEFKILKIIFLIVDITFILYWLITFFALIPESYLFKDYHNPILVTWNWSFLPLDLFISYTGLTSLMLKNKNKPEWKLWALISLVLTFCSGLQAISFWAIGKDFDPIWWFFNGILLIYPLFFIKKILKSIKEFQID